MISTDAEEERVVQEHPKASNNIINYSDSIIMENTGNKSNDSQEVFDTIINPSADFKSQNYSPTTSRYGRTIRSKLHGNMLSEEAAMQTSNGNGVIVSKKTAKEAAKTDPDTTEIDNLENTLELSKDSNSPSNGPECTWVLGQLAWARVGAYPFWPCVVNLEPVTMIYQKVRTHGKSLQMGIHVQYFGDNGRHSWVSANNLIPFTGIKDFISLSESLTPEMKKKDAKYAAAFIVKSNIKAKWDTAVTEAMEVLSMTDEQRAEAFRPQIKSPKTVTPKVQKINAKEKSRKRKLSPDNNEPVAKQMRKENADSEVDNEDKLEKPKARKQRRENNDNKVIEVNLNANTPPTPPSSHKDSSDEAPQPRKPKARKLKKIVEGDFEIYFERNKDRIEEEQPDASESEIRRYLKKTWASMNIVSKSSYQVRLKPKVNGFNKLFNQVRLKPKNISQRQDSSSEEEEEQIFNSDKKSVKSSAEKSDAIVSENINGKKKRPYNIFRGMKQERVCQICEKTGKLTRCRGPCYSYFHLSCVKPGESSPENSIDGNTTEDELFNDLKEIKEVSGEEDDNNQEEDELNDDKIEDKSDEPIEQSEEEAFKCIDCLSGVAPACFICNEREGDRIRCTIAACGKHYHSACLKPWPQSHWQVGRLSCPYHVCHTCSSDNPRDSHHSRVPNEKLARCVRCPSSYHPSIICLPAGSTILTGSQIICPKHHKAPHPPLNAAWCFLCTRGGSLICCDTCPTSFHPECLGIDAPDGAFICEDCETGRLPLYGEVTWVKLGNYRWWPSVICYPHEIPHNVLTIPHSPGEFCVMFLGTKDYYWVHRGRAFLYQDGDANTKTSVGKKNVDEAYRRALEEAQEMHLRLKIERAAPKDVGTRGLKPSPYVKLKVNKPVGNIKAVEVESMAACDCDPDWDNPCAPETDCLNRILAVECSSGICPAGTKCGNQAFVRRQYPSMEPFHTAGRGWGLKALEFIKSGQFVVEYVGEVIDEAEYKRRLQRKKELKDQNFYFLTIDNFRMIDAEPKGNLSRFMNHSCQPNCETQKWTVNGDTRIGLFALRDIESGEELTFNYNLACDGETRKPCLCGAPNCSGFIGLKAQKSLQQLNTVQDKKVEKIKKQKRLSRAILCWTCGNEISDDENLVLCDQKTCNKRYHKSCVTVGDSISRFSCPWHLCAVCGRRTSAHCSFCSTAYCQAHIDGKLIEHGNKGVSRLVCQSHGTMDFDNNDSENDTENEKEESPIGFSSPILAEKPPPREPSPRVSIVEVHVSSEEGEESQKEDDDEQVEDVNQSVDEEDEKIIRKKASHVSRRFSLRKQRQEEANRTLNALTSSQLEAIIGGSVLNDSKIN